MHDTLKLLCAAAAIAAIIGPASAQTATPPPLPPATGPAPIFVTKAPPLQRSAFIRGSGFYLGVGASAAVAASSVSGNVFSLPGVTGGGLSAAGGTVDIDAGYIWGTCVLNTWCQLELDGQYANITGSTAVGTISSQWALTQEFDIGADVIQTVLAYLPSAQNPFPSFNPSSLLPANIAVATVPRGYVGFKQGEYLINGNIGQAGGQNWVYAPGVTSGFRWQTLGTNGAPNGGSIKVHVDVMWPTRGVDISNVFGVGGGPIVTQPSAAMNTIYVAGFQYDFGVGY